MKRVLIVFCLIILISSVSAANHYVRAGATGNNDGSDWNNALTSLPSILIRGDTYYIADGIYSGYTFDDLEADSAYIYIKKAIESDHGTNTGWLSTYDNGQAVFGPLNFLTGYYILEGQTGGGPGSWKTGHGFRITGDYIVLIEFINAVSDITIRHTEIHFATSEVDDTKSTDHVYGLRSGTANITFEYNYFHDTSRVFILSRGWDDVLVQYNMFARNRHTSGKHAEGWSDHNGDRYIIRYNRFEDIEGTGITVLLYGDGYDWEIYGNLVYWTGETTNYRGTDNGGFTTRSAGAYAYNWKIYNNVVANSNLASGSINTFHRLYQGGGSIIQNNIWYNSVAYPGGSMIIDYNLYIQSGTGKSIGSNDITESSGSNPFINSANYDFHLSSPTDPGFSLPSPYNQDMEGNIRGADGNWDRGAYEYISSIPCTIDADCNNGNFCDGIETCSGGTCQSGTSPCADDGYSCKTLCDEVTDKCNVPNNALCDDSNTCTTDSCVGAGGDVNGCSYSFNTNSCIDGFGCTEFDICDGAGNCGGTPNNNLCLPLPSNCTSGTCNAGSGCDYLPAGCDVPSDLILWIKADDNLVDSTATDSSGNNLHGTCTNCPTYVAGAGFDGSGAYQFDNSNDFIEANSVAGIITNYPFTFAAWINTASSDYDSIVSMADSFSDLTYFEMQKAGDGIPAAVARIDSSFDPAYATVTVNDGTWHHIAAVFTNSIERRIYVDGGNMGENILSKPFVSVNNLNIGRLGRLSDTNYFNGLIDDVRVYDRSLSASEIQAIYNSVSSCTSTADTSGDDIVDIMEIMNYISSWKAGSITSNDLASGIGEWKNGC